jgi:23S rRNA pseudouridine2605 synthase
LNREQLQATRAQRWHQNGEALLTLEAAREWLQETGLCLFLPRKMQLPAPAPSFVEAFLGETNATPSLEAIENATALLSRLTDDGDILALNLLGMAGEQPDFLVTPEYLGYIFSLRGDRDWKHDPSTTGTGRVSPLVLEIWKTIERTGVQTAIEIRETLGKELTEAAVLRGLKDLWTRLRVILLPGSNGEPATWEAVKTRFENAMVAGKATSQVTALSVLLARYLQSAVAATSEEAEIFLSPLASRTKVREVIRGLSATRQLSTYSLDTQPLLYVEGTLPEFGEPIDMADIEPIATVASPPPPPPVSMPMSGSGLSIELIPPGSSKDSHSPTSPHSKIRKYTPRPVVGPDPLRWKRDSSVPLPPGKRRSSTGDPVRDEARGARPESEKFATRRSSPRPAATRTRTGSDVTGSPRRSSATGGERKRWTPAAGSPSERPRRESAAGDRPARPPYSPRSTGARPPASGEAGARPRTGYPKTSPTKIGPRREGAIPGEGAGSAKKGRWVPRTGAGDGRDERPRRDAAPRREGGYAGPSGRTSPRSGGGEFKGRDFKDRSSRPPSTGSRGASSSFRPRPESASRPSFDRPRSDRPARPFSKPGGSKFASRREGTGAAGGERPTRPSFVKPWDEDKKSRPSSFRPRTEGSGSKPAGFRPRPAGSRPSGPRLGGAGVRPRTAGTFESRRPDTGSSAGSGERRTRTFGARPSTGRPSTGRPSSTGRPPAGRPFSPRPSAGRPAAGGKSFGARPSTGRPSTGRPSTGRPLSTGRPSSGRPASRRPSFGGKPGFKSGAGGKGGKPGGFSKKRNPGDYPKRKKRPE